MAGGAEVSTPANVDVKREWRDLYSARAGRFDVVEVTPMWLFRADGHGDPVGEAGRVGAPPRDLPLGCPQDRSGEVADDPAAACDEDRTVGAVVTGHDPTPESRFVAASGLVIDEVTATSVRGHADVGEDDHTAWGTIHGGVYTSLVESAGGAGAGRAIAEPGQAAVGIHNGTDFLRASPGSRVTITAEALYQGRSQQLWDVVINQDRSGKALARGQLRQQNVPRPESRDV